jgi:hypothetical protein
MEINELEASMTAAAAESELEMVHVKEKSDALQEKLTSGLKKRFFYETKALKAKGSPLDEDEQKEALRQAAEAIKSRFERDQLVCMIMCV